MKQVAWVWLIWAYGCGLTMGWWIWSGCDKVFDWLERRRGRQ